MNIRIIQSMLSRILLAPAPCSFFPPSVPLLRRAGAFLPHPSPAVPSSLPSSPQKKSISQCEPHAPGGTAITALSWIAVSLLYAIPYICSGTLSPLDGLVESVSGLTGTGATVINDLSPLPPSILSSAP